MKHRMHDRNACSVLAGLWQRGSHTGPAASAADGRESGRLLEKERRHDLWLYERRTLQQQEEIRQLQWWEDQRHDLQMLRREGESRLSWRRRQRTEQHRHGQELRALESSILSAPWPAD